MNPIIANERNKKKCQKFTPLNKVDDMLDLAGYSRDLFGKKVLEYSFGSGNIIKQIVKRYVEDALTQNIDVNNISSGLSADIYGIELDPQLYDQCISDLNEIVRSYGISTVNWSFVCTDALQWTTDIKFDFIIGNPPYISYHDIDETNRKFIRQNFRTCKKGKFDYCYAFLEKRCRLTCFWWKDGSIDSKQYLQECFCRRYTKKTSSWHQHRMGISQ